MASLNPHGHSRTNRAAVKDHGGANRAHFSGRCKKKAPLAGFLGGREGRTNVEPTRMGVSCSLLEGSLFSNHAKGVVPSQSLRRCSNSA